MFLENFGLPEVTQCQTQAVGRAWNNLKSDAIATELATLTAWGLVLSLTSPIYSLF